MEEEQPWVVFLVALAHPFYCLHTCTFVSYLLARQIATANASPIFRDHLFHREVQALFSFAVVLCIKYSRSISVEAFWADAFLYAKGILILLTCIVDRRLAAWYLVVLAVIFLLFQQPPHGDPGNVAYMTPLQLENQLLDGNSSKIWLIEFRAVWSPRCIQASRIFSDLSLRYSTEDFNFGSVDLGRFPKASEKYYISLGASAGQLPTYVLFEGGTEVSRLPQPELDGKLFAEYFDKSTIAKYFELDRRLICFLAKVYSKRV